MRPRRRVILHVWFRPAASACKLHRSPEVSEFAHPNLRSCMCSYAAYTCIALFATSTPIPTGKDTRPTLAGMPDDGVSPHLAISYTQLPQFVPTSGTLIIGFLIPRCRENEGVRDVQITDGKRDKLRARARIPAG